MHGLFDAPFTVHPLVGVNALQDVLSVGELMNNPSVSGLAGIGTDAVTVLVAVEMTSTVFVPADAT
jgi:hypothetical protein